MKHRVLAFIIALLSGAITTLLLIPANLSNEQLWSVFFVVISISFLLVWGANEFIFFRDLHKIEMFIKAQRGNSKQSKSSFLKNIKLNKSKHVADQVVTFFNNKNAEVAKLIEKSNLRKQFIADISHELKSPLFSAQGYVLTLLDGAIKDIPVREKFLKKAARNLDYIDMLIQDLLTLSQLESEAIRMVPDHFDVVALVKEVVDDRENKALKAAVTLRYNFDKSPVIVYGDYSRITQVVNNLVNNGINYSKKGSSVTIDIAEIDETVRVSVIDSGVGIDTKYHEKIFNRFFRVDKNRTVRKSTGLGLAIVKHILEHHGSKINLVSEVGKGSNFSFVLPRDKKSAHVS